MPLTRPTRTRPGDEGSGSVRAVAVSKRFGEAHALRSVSLDVGPGETVSLLGPSGCGKTTLLRAICGLLDVDDGEILLGGQVVSGRGRTTPVEKRNVGMVFQSYALWPHLSVLDNVAYGLTVRRLPKSEVRTRAVEAIEAVGLAGFEGRFPSELSGGQQQRVALARSLVVRPEVLLLDEPLSNLDAALRDSMRKDLRRILTEYGTTAIYVTHDQREALYLSDRIALMLDGEIVQLSPPRDLYENPVSAFAARFVGNANVLPLAGGTVTGPGDLEAGQVAGLGQVLGRRTVERPHPGERVAVAWHPQRSRVVAADTEPTGTEDGNAFPGQVISTSFEGRYTEVAVRLADGAVVRVEGQDEVPSVGDSVIVLVPYANTLLLRA
jgi:ABC-type Fe3+/spermidine/putrescine transport system ATPase subunit